CADLNGLGGMPGPAPRTRAQETTMSSKKKTTPHEAESPKSLKVGSRVRCTDDGVEGRLVWANATTVKIRWDDGEQVTRPLEILDPATDEPVSQPDEPVPTPALDPPTESAVEPTAAEPEPAKPVAADPTPPEGETTQPAAEQPEAAQTAKQKQRDRKEPK